MVSSGMRDSARRMRCVEAKSKRREIATILDGDLDKSHVGVVDGRGERVGEFLGDADARCCRHGTGREDSRLGRCWVLGAR